MSRPKSHRRPLILIALHWLTLLVLLLALATILARELVDDAALRKTLLAVHRQLGMGILVLVLLRLTLRFAVGRLAGAPRAFLQKLAAGAVHTALYVVLLALPLLGWAASNARGHAVSFFGIPVPDWIAERDVDLADELIQRHQWAAWCLLALAMVHVAAALWHHFVRRDDVLLGMLPKRFFTMGRDAHPTRHHKEI